jgi:hypothetical protein
MSPKSSKTQLSLVKAILLVILPGFIYSCNNASHPSGTEETKLSNKDSVSADAKSIVEATSEINFDRYEEKKRLELKNYVVSIQVGYNAGDTARDGHSVYGENYVLIARSKLTGKADTMLLKEANPDFSEEFLTDHSDSLHFKLCLEINWRGDSDMPMSEFVGYWHDSLCSFFTTASLSSLTRKDEWTLTGFISQSDAIVHWQAIDYPFSFSFKDFDIEYGEPPAVEYIDWSTKTLEPVQGFKMISERDSIRYTIKKGINVRVDTFYRAAGKIILTLPDSTKFHTKFEEVEGKLESNNAG